MPVHKTPSGLSPKQETFCREYLIDFNAARAARAAGYAEDSARVTGCQLLTNPSVQTHIEKIKRERFKRLDLDADWTLRELELNVQMARDKGDVSAANTAIAQIARIRGENQDSLRLGRFDGMSDQELRDLAEGKTKL